MIAKVYHINSRAKVKYIQLTANMFDSLCMHTACMYEYKMVSINNEGWHDVWCKL